ncbi:hypothetical protein GNY06_06570 [Elizabethkingia argentiflava]|uniref:DUF5683 domain-containing protein n=1 Tax=Elizabethkingia argenteiflava TaxID=2681556 RepID=A0A845PX56_9FLAO|nr:DUF5683 domain-containing protein [Elizabethkingia argenteiflava]NAW51047.1 hypothetical protein [Elizabethkingia argenteiflava]
MKKLIVFFSILSAVFCFSQKKKSDSLLKPSYVDSLKVNKTPEEVIEDIHAVNALPQASIVLIKNPTKAGLYSAVMPGLGQAYNRKYWKIPIVWGALGTGVGIALWNDKQYRRYRTAFIAELNGQRHEFSDISGITKEVLGRTQDRAKRQRDYVIAITAGLYILNIIDAVVDAHLSPMKNDPDLAFVPVVIADPIGFQASKAGVGLRYRF